MELKNLKRIKTEEEVSPAFRQLKICSRFTKILRRRYKSYSRSIKRLLHFY